MDECDKIRYADTGMFGQTCFVGAGLRRTTNGSKKSILEDAWSSSNPLAAAQAADLL